MSISSMISNRLMMGYGPVALAAQGVAGKIGMLLHAGMGICMGMQPAISYNCGRGSRERMNHIIQSTGIFTVILGTFSPSSVFCPRPDYYAFIDNAK